MCNIGCDFEDYFGECVSLKEECILSFKEYNFFDKLDTTSELFDNFLSYSLLDETIKL